MKFHSRSTRLQDLPACQALITDHFAYSPQQLTDLVAMWRYVIEHEAGVSRVVCDSESGCVLAFGISVFISDDEAERIRNSADLLIGRNMLQRWSCGAPAFLDEIGIATANSTAGLNCVVTHHGYAALEPSERELLWRALAEAFFIAHKGLFFRTYLHKVLACGWMVPFLKNGLLPIDREYNDSEAEACGVPFEARPVISMRVTAEDAKMAPGNFVFGDLFRRIVPKTNMRRVERQLLRLALEGDTDKVLAEILEVSLATIKKRWRAIHALMREQLPPERECREGTRGTEERRHVLAYIRDHLEELFPHLPVNA